MLAIKPWGNTKAFTLVELLVVVFIVLILLAIIIPAIQYARESSRKLSCINNLKQLALALNNYEATYRVYPQGANGGLYSAQVMLLPHIEQTNLYNSINFVAGGPLGGFSSGECNETVAKTSLTTLICPSDPNSVTSPITNYGWNGGFGLQTDKFVGGFGSAVIPKLGYIGNSSITDGLSCTTAASEWKLGYFNSDDDTTVVFKVEVRTGEPYSTFIEDCLKSSRATTEFGSWTKDASWYQGVFGSSILNFNSIPNSRLCWFGSSYDHGNWPISSYHPHGVNVLFFDGHVQFESNSISLPVLQSLSTKAGNDNF